MICTKCGAEKPESFFRPLRKSCRQCESIAAVEWSKKNRLKKRASNNAYHKSISGKRAETTARWRMNHPDSYLAHKIVQTVVRNGTLKRMPCFECGATDTHAHHENYARPLDVTWLCHWCHMAKHYMLAERNKEKQ